MELRISLKNLFASISVALNCVASKSCFCQREAISCFICENLINISVISTRLEERKMLSLQVTKLKILGNSKRKYPPTGNFMGT